LDLNGEAIAVGGFLFLFIFILIYFYFSLSPSLYRRWNALGVPFFPTNPCGIQEWNEMSHLATNDQMTNQ